MKIVIDMSIGMMCTIGALILIVITAIWFYKNSTKLTNHPIIATVAIIALILSVVTIVFLFFSKYSINNISFCYSDASIAALSILTAFLVGWNIWSTIECKNLENKVEHALDKMHDKINYDFGVIHSYFAQMLALSIGDLPKDTLKFLMVGYMVNSVKILLKQPNSSKEIESTISSVLSTFQQTPEITITKAQAVTLIEQLGEIENRDKIEKLNELKAEISKYL